MKVAVGFTVALLALAGPAQAHRPSDAFLTLDVDGSHLRGQWEIALRDLAIVADIDTNRDRAITWGELRSARAAIDATIEDALTVAADGRACPVHASDLLINDRVEGRFAWIGLEGKCSSAPVELHLQYRLLFEIDPTHRGILVLTAGSIAQTAILAPDNSQITLRLSEPSRWRQFADYVREGVHHIWIGPDHILFLVSLLLPCVFARRSEGWTGETRLPPVLTNVFAVVTAFTAAHSITLALAAFGVLRLPTSLTEGAIALSVLFAALNNVWPLTTRNRWGMAFGFGLFHGFGFASVLGELGLPAGARLLALVGFNAGVEVGQLSIVAVALSLGYPMRGLEFSRRAVISGGSLAIAGIAAWWFALRSGLVAGLAGVLPR